MADFSKIKGKGGKKNRFTSTAPTIEPSSNLEAPESAPVNPETKNKKARGKTGRVKPFSTRVTQEFLDDIREIGFRMKLKKVEVLEEALKTYKEKNEL